MNNYNRIWTLGFLKYIQPNKFSLKFLLKLKEGSIEAEALIVDDISHFTTF